MDEAPEPKISLVEAILIGIIFALFDLVGIVLVIFGLDDFFILDILSSPIFLYLYIKGVPSMKQLVAWIVEIFPWAGALPSYSIGWWLTVWADHHPSSALTKAGQVAAAAKGRTSAAAAKGGLTAGGKAATEIKAGEKQLQAMNRSKEVFTYEQTIKSASGQNSKFVILNEDENEVDLRKTA